MSNWDGESFDGIINHGHFGITDPGPLHVPIRSFSIQRNEKLELVLETHCSEDAKSTLIEHPAGTVRINTDAIELTNIGGIKARAVGVQPLHVGTSINYQTGDVTSLSGLLISRRIGAVTRRTPLEQTIVTAALVAKSSR